MGQKWDKKCEKPLIFKGFIKRKNKRQLNPLISLNERLSCFARKCSLGRHTESSSRIKGEHIKRLLLTAYGSIPIWQEPEITFFIISSMRESFEEIILSGNISDSAGGRSQRGTGAQDSTEIVRKLWLKALT